MGRWTVCICIKRYFTVVSVMHSWNGKRVARSHVIASNVYKCLHEAAPTYLTEMVSFVSASVSRRHLFYNILYCDLAVPRYRTMRRSTKLHCLWSDTMEHTAADRACPITDTKCTKPSQCHWHWFSFVHLWRRCYSAELMEHYHSASVKVRIAPRTQMCLY